MHSAEQFILEKLKQREMSGSLRKLSALQLPVDFCSNDYLGFARSETLQTNIQEELNRYNSIGKNGSGGSRLLSGNTRFAEDTEASIAAFHAAEAGLLFNSGYDANLGLLSSLAQRGDTIITDELIHASLTDGARLGHALRYTFRHNDITDLETKLQHSKGKIYVVVESVYSMDGDLSPLLPIYELCQHYQANLIVDEAHATGIFGPYGQGLVQQLNLEQQVFARIITFGKALGCHGAIVLGSKALRQYLINFARSFIYTTAMPPHAVAAIKCAYDLLQGTDYPAIIQGRIKLFSKSLQQADLNIGTAIREATPSAIQTINYAGNQQARSAAGTLQNKGMDVRAILSPTVPEGKERLRICLHTYNTDQEIVSLTSALSEIK